MLLKTLKYELFLCLYLAFTCPTYEATKYEPTWQSLNSRPLPSWFDADKIGIRIYWGVYAVPGFKTHKFDSALKEKDEEIVKFMKENYRPGFKYADFAPELNGEFFDADRWVSMFQKAGIKFVILYTRHEDGYTLFPSKRSPGWNSVDVGPHIDVAKELANATRKHGLKFGISYWLEKSYDADHVLSDLKQQVEDYKPWIILPYWNRYSNSHWSSKKFLAYLYNESPVKDNVVVSDGWGQDCDCPKGCIRHGYDIDFRRDKGQLGIYDVCWSDIIWTCGYRRNLKLKEIYTIEELLRIIVYTVSTGGNIMLGLGPNKDGMIDPIFEERLLQVGEWLSINGKAIYHSSPWTHQKESDDQIFYTCQRKQKDRTSEIEEVYVIFFKWPDDNILKLKNVIEYLKSSKMAPVALLGNPNHRLKLKYHSGVVLITLPEQHLAKSRWAWVVQFKPRTNSYRKSESLNYYFNIPNKIL